jgi:hypothetical protein
MPSPYPPPFLPVPPPPPRRPTNPYAIGSLVCGLAAPFTGVLSVPAVVLGHTAKSKLRTTGEEGDGLANAGIVLGWLSVVLWMLILVAAIA